MARGAPQEKPQGAVNEAVEQVREPGRRLRPRGLTRGWSCLVGLLKRNRGVGLDGVYPHLPGLSIDFFPKGHLCLLGYLGCVAAGIFG